MLSLFNQGAQCPLAFFALCIVLSTAGCDLQGSDPGQETDSPEIDQTLAPGEAAVPAPGVHLMAPTGALDASLTVSAQEASAPTAETPLPETVGATGPFFRIGGSQNVDLSSQEPSLYVALPVPENADPAHLALGIRTPRRYVTDTGPSAPAYSWTFLPGAYEPERGLLVVPVPFLVADGIVLTVVQHPAYSAPSMAGTSGETLFEKTKRFFSRETALKSAAKSNTYKIKCKGFSGGSCGSDEKNDVRQYLKEVHRDFVSAFREPDLRSPLFSDKHVWIIKKKGKAWCKGSTGGKYLSLTNTAITCYDGSSDPSEGTTRHEFFHAIQYNYAPISWSKLPKQRPDWIIEATADIAESPQSNASTAVRSGGSLRSIDTPLPKSGWKPNFPEYKAKDFWVYLINSRGSTLEATLEPLFKQQSNAVNKPTAKKVDQLYGLEDDYWGWVRNQAFESQVTTGYDGALNGACRFNGSTASPKTVTYDAGTRTSPKEVFKVVPRLSAQVVAVKVQTGSKRIDLTITARAQGAKSYVKAYRPYRSSTRDCWGSAQNASDTLTDMMQASTQKTYYVLLATTMIDPQLQRTSFAIEISHQNRLTK